MADGRINSCKECRKGYQRSRPHDKECERNQAEKLKAYHAANLKRWRSENPQKPVDEPERRRLLRFFKVQRTLRSRNICYREGLDCTECSVHPGKSPRFSVPRPLQSVASAVYSRCRLVRNQIDTIKESGAPLLLSLSPPITPKCASGSSSFIASSYYL